VLRVRRGPKPRFCRLLLVRIAPITPAEPPVCGAANSFCIRRSLLDPAVCGRISSLKIFFSFLRRLSFLRSQNIKPSTSTPASMQPMMRPALRVRPPSRLLKSSGGGTGAAVPVGVSEVDEADVVLIVIIVPLEVLVLGELKNEVRTVDMDLLTEVVVEVSGAERADVEGPSSGTVVTGIR